MSASRRFDASAERVAKSGDPETGSPQAELGVDLGGEVVEQVTAKHQFSASAQLISVADDMWRALMSVQEQSQRR